MSNLSELLPAGGGGKNVAFVASGTLGNGVTVVLNTDGTVEAVAVTAEVIGTPATFQASARSDGEGCAYDSNTNKVVVFYLKQASNQIWGVVGTVSGSTISFGTPVLMVSSIGVYDVIGCLYDPVSQNVIYGWRQGTSSGLKVIIATVSGTSLTFGSPTAIDTGNNENGASMVYDTNANKILFAYSDATNSQYATGRVGTISGQTISFGTKTVIQSVGLTFSSMAYDSVAQKIVLAYRSAIAVGVAHVATISGTGVSYSAAFVFQANAGGYFPKSTGCAYDAASNKTVIGWAQSTGGNGLACTATVSGTSLTFGTPVTFAATNIQTPLRLVYDANAQQVLAIYSDLTNSYSGRLNTLSVSGSAITVGTQVVWNSTTSNYIYAAYDSTAKKTVMAYSNNSVDGEALVYSPSSSNNTSFIGITDAAISSGASGSVTIKGGIATLAGGTYAVTVANPGSGNRYYIDGILQQKLYLREGFTYKFDQSAGSNGGHPLRFSTTANGTHAGGSEYTTGVTTNGVPGNAGAYTQIVVAAGAPTLYYYCSVHSLMGGTANTLTGIVANSIYYVQSDGTLSTTSSTVLAGKALSSTSINLEYTS